MDTRKRPRHFHQGLGPETDVGNNKVNLYRHALESIFAFFSLSDLHTATSVSKSWCLAVDKMRGIDATIEQLPDGNPLFGLCASRLARHIGTIGIGSDPLVIDQAGLYLVGLRMTSLHTLYYRRLGKLPFVGPLIFPPSLTHLSVECESVVTVTNRVILAASHLSSLNRLDLNARVSLSVNLAPLRGLPSLQTLHFKLCTNDNLTLQQSEDLRAMPSLTHLRAPFDSQDMRMLLSGAPHQLALRALSFGGIMDDDTISLLASLHSISNLGLGDTNELKCLASLPNLTTLQLDDFALQPILKGTIIGGQCAHLTQLSINTSGLTSAQLGALLSRMPRLCKLYITEMQRLESLEFLSAEPLASTLTRLELEECCHAQLSADELHHVFSLRNLEHLQLVDCFSERLDSLTLREFKVPSLRLPSLVSSFIDCPGPAPA